MELQNQVDVEPPGVGFNGLITGVGVRFPGVTVLEIFPGYIDSASEWRVDLTMGFKLAWVAVTTADYG